MVSAPSPARETGALPRIPLSQNGLYELCGKNLIDEKRTRFLRYLVVFFRGHFSD
jgi:hypothetical protein